MNDEILVICGKISMRIQECGKHPGSITHSEIRGLEKALEIIYECAGD